MITFDFNIGHFLPLLATKGKSKLPIQCFVWHYPNWQTTPNIHLVYQQKSENHFMDRWCYREKKWCIVLEVFSHQFSWGPIFIDQRVLSCSLTSLMITFTIQSGRDRHLPYLPPIWHVTLPSLLIYELCILCPQVIVSLSSLKSKDAVKIVRSI